MPKRTLINELKKLLRQRGQVTKQQREYAKIEERAMMQMYVITKPAEEKRFSHHRTLKSYIGEHALKIIMERNGNIEAVQ